MAAGFINRQRSYKRSIEDKNSSLIRKAQSGNAFSAAAYNAGGSNGSMAGISSVSNRPVLERGSDESGPAVPSVPSVPPKPSEPSANGSGGSGNGGNYASLIETLNRYGISFDLPSLSSLYSQLSAFLRPSVDAAIEDRRSYGDYTLAELDADAYSRGMGGSTYLSSMKMREYDSIARDVAKLESNYDSKIAEYMYNAQKALNEMKLKLAELQLNHAFDMEKLDKQHQNAIEQLRYRSELASQQESGNADDEDEFNQIYDEYYAYMLALTPDERNSFLTSNKKFWKNLRESAKSALGAKGYHQLITELFYSGDR